MNPRERYLAVLRGETVDPVPAVPILMAFAAEAIGSNYGAFASDYRVLVEANRHGAAAYGFCQWSAISDPYRETSAFGGEVEFIPDGVPRLLAPPLAEGIDLERLATPDMEASPRLADRLAAVREMHRLAGATHSVMGWVEGPAASAANLLGPGEFLLQTLADPEALVALMEHCNGTGIAFARAQIAAGADTIGIGDAIASQVSEDVYTELVLPLERALVQAIHDAGAHARLHICGDISHLLASIATLGADIVDCDWQVDPVHAREALGPGTVLTGFLNPVDEVLRGTPEAIARRQEELAGLLGPRFLRGAGCEIPKGTPPANLRAVCSPAAGIL